MTHPSDKDLDRRINEGPKIRTYMLTTSHLGEITLIRKEITKSGAHYCGHMEIPARNVWGHNIGIKYLVVYQHTNELDIPLYT